jgi:hypothetical protein
MAVLLPAARDERGSRPLDDVDGGLDVGTADGGRAETVTWSPVVAP